VRSWKLVVKRAFDLLFTVVALVCLLPVGLVLAVVIILESPGSAIYRSRRVGKGGQVFTLYKFRTMVVNAETIGPSVTHAADPRVTRVGRLLRRTKFDEFPQVLNVLKGDVSIVGPRPETPKYVALYSADQLEVLRVAPGLTSLAQVVYREEEKILPSVETEAYYLQKVLPRKLALDLYYAKTWSLGLDSRIFLMGVLALLRISPPAVLWPFKDEVRR